MPFSDLPNEVIHLILGPAVRARGLKRAVRLRLVNRVWNVAVEDAIFASGVLDEDNQINRVLRDVDFAFWHRYLVYRALHNRKPSSTRLALIRQVAERIAEIRGHDLHDSQEILRECVDELCRAVLVFREVYGHLETYVASKAEPNVQLDEGSSEFQRALMTAAAYMNDLDLGRQLLPLRPDPALRSDCPPANNAKTQYTLGFFFDPYTMAAYRGNLDFISLLLENEPETTIYGNAHRLTITYNAIWGSRIGVLDQALGPSFGAGTSDFMELRQSLVSGLSHIPSIDVFKRCFDLVQDSLQYPCRPYNGIYRQKWLSERFHRAAECGAVPVMEYLAELGTPVDGHLSDEEDEFSSPISLAAFNGHENAVKWLLGRGANLARSLHAAVTHGSRRIVQVLLDHGAMNDTCAVQKALLETVKTENEGLFRFLVEQGAVLDKATIIKAIGIAEKEQLESMVEFLRESF
ncbi:ankyrin [Hypoxylon cercidicola]|nr:ankyrin [Hypoxylon cercidicola]